MSYHGATNLAINMCTNFTFPGAGTAIFLCTTPDTMKS